MNYRHAFHAGNFADVLKHVVLARILHHLRLKPKPFRFIDTHAGLGRYDLSADEATRTGEWRDGIGRLARPFDDGVEGLLAPFRAAVAATRERHGPSAYPGSPEIAANLLRPDDAAILIEKHPADAAVLARHYRRRPDIKVLEMDGWTGLRSLIPPKERRGLVLVDPPYEQGGELEAGLVRLAAAHRRWPTGILALWYPVKAGQGGAVLPPADLAAEILLLELTPRPVTDGRLAGSGLLVVNPPWTLRDDAQLLLPALAERLGQDGSGSYRIEPAGGTMPAGSPA